MDNSWGVPALILHYVMIAHLCGGALLAIGLLTLLQIPVLAGAVFLVLFLLILLFIVGPGRLSMDYYIFGSRKKDNER
jgi:putative oxidoreductase